MAKDVGIVAIELLFPSQYVDQNDLEKHDQVSEGKYTIGLGQNTMGFCTDREDINSLCLTVVSKLMRNNNIDYTKIGFLQVGTETIIDKSKSVKTVLMQLFESSGNYDVEGIDTTSACYGGTAALFSAISWVESSGWDGRLAIAVAADIAVYAEGTARPTGGAGAVAMLIGPNAPLILESRCRASYMRHAYDFYKPDLTSTYPVVDGKLSIQCYLNALDECYQLFCKKANLHNLNDNQPFSIDNLDAMLFHTPYCKLVQKSYARLLFNDFVKTPKEQHSIKYSGLEQFEGLKLEETYFNRDLEKVLMTLSNEGFLKKTKSSLFIASHIGNMYTASLYGGLVSLIMNKTPNELAGNRIGLFSYGSGLTSTMYVIRVSSDSTPDSALSKMVAQISHLKTLLNDRHRVAPNEFSEILRQNEQNCHKVPFKPTSTIERLYPGTYYLEYIDEKHRRSYKQVPL